MRNALTISLFVVVYSGAAIADPWYTNEKWRCSDGFNLNPIFFSPFTKWFERTEFKLRFPLVSQGYAYAELNSDYFSDIQKSGPQGKVVQTLKLDDAVAKSLRNFFMAKAESDVSFIMKLTSGLGGAVAGTYLGGIGGIAAGTTIDYIMSIKEIGRVKASFLAGQVAPGGRIERFQHLSYDTRGLPFIVEDFRYLVSAEDEARHYILSSCVWAVSVRGQDQTQQLP